MGSFRTYWKADFVRSFFSVRFLATVLLIPFFDYLTILIGEYSPQLELIEALNWTKEDGFIFFIYVIYTIPYSHSYCEDLCHRYIDYHVIRSGIKSYVKQKMLFCAFASGAAVFLGKLLTVLILSMQFPYDPVHGPAALYLMDLLLMAAFEGTLFGCIAFTASTWIPDTFFVCTVPLLADNLLKSILYLFPETIYRTLLPVCVYDMNKSIAESSYGAVVYAVIFTVFWIAVLYQISKQLIRRRIENA